MNPSHSSARRGRYTAALLLTLFALFTNVTAADFCSVSSFDTPRTFPVRSVRALAFADFNGDGKLDLAAANEFPSTGSNVSVLLGDGAGGFGPTTSFPSGRFPVAIATADFNGDGKADLVTANSSNISGDLSILLGNGAGSFGPASPVNLTGPGSSSSTNGVAVGDFNNDGKADLAASTNFGLAILLGNGNGTFASKFVVVGAPASFGAVVVGDFNKDGKADAAIVKTNVNAVAVVLGDGAGNFGAFADFSFGARPISLITADLNGDGTPDLAAPAIEQVSGVFSGFVSVLLGDGDGGFGVAAKFGSGGTSPVAVAAADFNGDGRADLAAVNSDPAHVYILQGDGAGGFVPAANYLTGGTNPSSVVAPDLNGDGEPDLVVGNNLSQRVGVLLNSCGAAPASPSLQFTSPTYGATEELGPVVVNVIRTGSVLGAASVSYATSDGTAGSADYTPASGTLNFADGETSQGFSVAITDDNISEGSESFNLTLSNAAGAALGAPSTAAVFISPSDGTPAITVNDPAAAEGNSGTTDIVFTVSLSNPSSSAVTVQYATADGTALAGEDFLAASGTLTFGPGETSKNLTVKVNGDTLDEITEAFFLNLTGPSNATVADAQGVGTISDDDSSCPSPSFGPPTSFAVGTNPWPAVPGDFNGDGKTDLAVGNFGSTNISVLPGNGAGSFGAPVTSAAGAAPRSLAAADFNGDGKLDVAAVGTNFGTQVAVHLGDGAGGFGPASNFAAGGGPMAVAAADFNGDGKTDLAVANLSSSNVSVLIGNGAGGFAAATNFALPSNAFSVAAADFNGDSRPDLAIAHQNSHSVSVLINNGSGGFGAASNFAAGTHPQWATVADFNLDGRPDLAVANQTSADVSVLLGDGAGGFGAAISSPAGSRPSFVLAADFNGDSRPDLAVSRSAPFGETTTGGVSVLFGNGAGRFTTPSEFVPGGGSLGSAAADFNSDGKADLAVTNFQSGSVSLLLNGCSFATSAPKVQFSSPDYRASEAAGSAVITVARSGDTSAPADVDYTTSDGTASARGDYTAAIGRLHFAAGEATKTFTVLITDDAHIEGDETVTLTLLNPSGASAGTPSSATLTITSDDVTAPAPNPVDGSSFFVRQHYRDFFSRDADAPGLAHWTNVIESCGADAQCREVNRINVSGAFFLSIEFEQTGYLVEKMYKAAYGDATGNSTLGGTPHTLTVPVIRFNEFLPDTQRIGRGVVVLAPGWEELLESNKQAYFLEFVQRSRFTTAFPSTLTPTQFVDQLNARAGNPLDATERQSLINELSANNTTAGRASVLRKVAEDATLDAAEKNRAFVLMQYFGYLRRNPNDPPDSDHTGYDFWLTNLEKAGGNFVQAELVKAFITSAEYRQRFGQ